MNASFETLGNASLLISSGGRPILATDPWLIGTCYFGSWALDHPLSEQQIQNMIAAEYIWFSHGHPDHLHDESLNLFPPGKKVLLPDHYSKEIHDHLRDRGFEVTILRYREWFTLSSDIRIMSIDNINQDAILVVEVGDAIIVNLNDSPLCGELGFLRRLIQGHAPAKTWLLALCSVDADMFNFIDESGKSLAGPPDERKPGAIWAVARTAARLGARNFCCSSSQHIYVRADSIWANPYRIGWDDMRQHWSRAEVRLIEPFVTVDLSSGEYTRNHPEQISDASQISSGTADDDWDIPLTEAEWSRVETFIRQFELIVRYIDFVAFRVGGETRRFSLNSNGSRADAKGLEFHVPKQSLLTTVEYGYFDDLLIGNFMRVRLIGTKLYPRFTPLVAKVGGNARVFTKHQYFRYLARYFRRNPIGMTLFRLETEFDQTIVPWLRASAENLGIKQPLKFLYRRLLGDPTNAGPAP